MERTLTQGILYDNTNTEYMILGDFVEDKQTMNDLNNLFNELLEG